MAKAKGKTKTKENFRVVKKKNGRYSVHKRNSTATINGEEKAKILASKGLIKAPTKKKVVEKVEDAAPAAE